MPYTKLGPHHRLGGADTRRWLEAARPTVAKAVGDFGVLQYAPAGTLTVGRMDDNGALAGQGFDLNRYAREQVAPGDLAAAYRDFLRPHIRANPFIQVWEGPNEQVFEHHHLESENAEIRADFNARRQRSMRWYAEFCWHFAREMHALGKRAGIGSWSAGNPLREHGLWPDFVRGLAATVDFPGTIHCRHDYGPLDEAYLLRYRWDLREFARLGYPHVPHLISEAGTDAVGGMWPWKVQYAGSIEAYWQQLLLPYAQALEADPDVLGAVVYSVGTEDDFNVDGTGLVERVVAFAGGRTPPASGAPARKVLTNQDVFNAVGAEGKARGVNLIGRMPNDLVDQMAAARTGPYTGPRPEDWGLTPEERAAVAARLAAWLPS